MEPKKNPVYDVHRYRGTLFAIGLITSISIVIMAFEWETKVTPLTICDFGQQREELIYTVPSKEHTYINKSVMKPVSVPLTFKEIEIEAAEKSDEIPVETTPEKNLFASVVPIVELPVDPVSDSPLIFAEVMPEPESGYKGFYELLGKSLRYPKKAQQNETEGKVFVSFIVNEQGDLSDVKVIKGIGSGCDEEAVRVLKLSKWKPGKQRGKPVKVRMIQPIHFRLNPR